MSTSQGLPAEAINWCPGCGLYSVHSSIREVLLGPSSSGDDRDSSKLVFVAGDDCVGKFPYYTLAYGFQAGGGQQISVAEGLAITRPELEVWVLLGDEDLARGGNALIHAWRRNVNLNIVFVRDNIMGLTKGQTSVSSPLGQRTLSTPGGSPAPALEACTLAISSEASFVARTSAKDVTHLKQTLEAASRHRGTSFVEVLQECVIFNREAYRGFEDSSVRKSRILKLEADQEMVFGEQGLLLTEMGELQVANSQNGARFLRHDTSKLYPYIHLLPKLGWRNDGFPLCLGVFIALERETYSEVTQGQEERDRDQAETADLNALFRGTETWEVT